MTMRAFLFSPALVAGLSLALCAPATGATLPFLPDFTAAVFVPLAPIDNTYFPLTADSLRILEASGTDADGDPVFERIELRGGGAGPVIAGVATTTMVDRAFEQGVLVEETFDHYAQDAAGNVWYMGEDVTNYVYDENGVLIGTNSSSSWRAGVNGALPGFAMPADPVVGFSYFQEFAALDAALDEGVIFGFLETLASPGQTFHDVLMVFETSTLDPLLREIKYYAPGYGLVRADEGVDANFGNPNLTFNVLAPVPLPAALPLLAVVLSGLGFLAHRRRRAM